MKPSDIDLTVDNHPRRVAAGTTLAHLIAQLGHQPEDIGCAVNGRFVPRAERASRELRGDDSVLLFRAIVGG
jgi:sulfur carrier protein